MTTTVSVQASSSSQGSIVVSTTLDSSATAVVGGRSALAAQLADSDLKSAGWTVTGPAPGPGSSTVVMASHPYSSLAEAGQLLAQVAGSGPPANRPFQLRLTQHRSFWHVSTVLAGRVDLQCGLGCFGDSGLQSLTGSPLGVNPSPLEQKAGQNPAQVFDFAFDVHLPGSIQKTDASARSGGQMQWTTPLGRTTLVSATSEDWNWTSIGWLITGASALLVAMVGLVSFRWWSHRQRQKPEKPQKRLHAKPRGWRRRDKAVTPSS